MLLMVARKHLGHTVVHKLFINSNMFVTLYMCVCVHVQYLFVHQNTFTCSTSIYAWQVNLCDILLKRLSLGFIIKQASWRDTDPPS